MRRFAWVPAIVFAVAISAWLIFMREPLPLWHTAIVAVVVFMVSWYMSRRQRTPDNGRHLVVVGLIVAALSSVTPSDAQTVDDGRNIAIGGFTFDLFGRPIQYVSPDGRVAKWSYKGITSEVTGVEIDGVRKVGAKAGGPIAMPSLIIEVEETAPPGVEGPSGGMWSGGGGYGGGGGDNLGGGGGGEPYNNPPFRSQAECEYACDTTFNAAMFVCGYLMTDPPVGLACIASATAFAIACRYSCRRP